MENTEIINELANAISQMVNRKVEEKTLTFDSESFMKQLKNCEFDTEFVCDVLSLIKTNYEHVFIEVASDWALCNDYVERDAIDDYWVYEHLSNQECREIAVRYIADNL